MITQNHFIKWRVIFVHIQSFIFNTIFHLTSTTNIHKYIQVVQQKTLKTQQMSLILKSIYTPSIYRTLQSVFNLFAGVIVPLLCEFESSEKFNCVDVKSVGP